MKIYNKLVRDKITDIIETDGRIAKYRILDDNEYRQELNKKLQEEVKEYLEDNNVEELADIVEVIYGILNSMDVSSKEFEKIMDICSRKKINVIKVKRGGKVEIDKSLYFEILHPSDKMLDDGKGGLNANAIVAKMYYKPKNGKKFTMLFTGDIEKDAEKELVKEYGKKLKVDILKVAHHGSKTSSIEEFLKLAMPETALIGVGQRNTFGHPNEGVLQRLKEKMGIKNTIHFLILINQSMI